jgi:hypothetical protein
MGNFKQLLKFRRIHRKASRCLLGNIWRVHVNAETIARDGIVFSCFHFNSKKVIQEGQVISGISLGDLDKSDQTNPSFIHSLIQLTKSLSDFSTSQ